MSVLLFNHYNFFLPSEFKNLINSVFSFIKKEFLLNENYEIEVSILNEKAISLINKEYRKINKPTDVLSFSFIGDIQKKKNIINISLIGVVYLCMEKINFFPDKPLIYNLIYLFIHGCLHILGYDHGEKMDYYQNKIISNFFRI